MLAHIATGYEGKFDFTARRQDPELTYLLASVPRAGSTYFSHLLWGTGCLGAPLEYLNFEPAGPYGFAGASPELQRQLWRSVLRRRCSPNGVFGLKAFPPQLEQLRRRNLPLLEEVFATILPQGRPRRIIYLRRRDRLAQTASYARASLSGVWRKEQESADAPRIEYSEEALEAAERGIAFQEAAWEQMFAELRIEPLLVWHEDVLADSAGAAEAVANYLEVLVDPQAAVDVPPIEKQSEGNSREWVERYGRSRETPPASIPDANGFS
jgi:LPS sulfotransferase NodH